MQVAQFKYRFLLSDKMGNILQNISALHIKSKHCKMKYVFGVDFFQKVSI